MHFHRALITFFQFTKGWPLPTAAMPLVNRHSDDNASTIQQVLMAYKKKNRVKLAGSLGVSSSLSQATTRYLHNVV